MQQQIQVQKNEEVHSQLIPAVQQLPINHMNFQLINDDEQIIEEDIMQNYEQDFDSISNNSSPPPLQNQIIEEFAQIEEIIPQFPEKGAVSTERHPEQELDQPTNNEAECAQLTSECQKLKEKIDLLQKQLKEAETEPQQETEQQMTKAFIINQKILQELQVEQLAYFQNKVGKDSFCLTLLASPEDYQEKVMQQIDKLKQLITTYNTDICRLRRQTKKNEQAFPLEHENQKEFYQHFKRVKKELEERRQKYEAQAQRELELDDKLQKLKERYFHIESSIMAASIDSKQNAQQKILTQYQQLIKKKESSIKKNALTLHQIQNNTQVIARHIQELRKLNSQLEEGIATLDKKNVTIEAESDKLMRKFQSRKQKMENKLLQSQVESNQSNLFDLPAQPKPPSVPPITRRKYHSQSKNSFITNIFNNTTDADPMIKPSPSQERYKPSISTKDKNFSMPIEKEAIYRPKMEQSSTANTLKQFKLKLPNHTPQKSAKNLNISLDISKNTPNRGKSKTDQSKLSITQRLQRIELLQREDRFYSHKLYEMQRKEEEQNLKSQVKEPLPASRPLPKDISSTGDLPNQKKLLISNASGPYDAPYLSSSKTQATIFQATNRTRQLLNLSKAIEFDPHHDNQSATERNPEPDAQTDSNKSALLTDRLHHKFLKKRIVYREKKISEDYMKILEQRGRKILELDNESQN